MSLEVICTAVIDSVFVFAKKRENCISRFLPLEAGFARLNSLLHPVNAQEGKTDGPDDAGNNAED